MQLSQTMKLREIELIIKAAFKFCMVLQKNRNPPHKKKKKKPALNKSY